MKKYMNFANRINSNSHKERIIIVIDQSYSMADTDWPPSRLIAAQQACLALIDVKIDNCPEDEVGIVAFSSSAKIIHQAVSLETQAATLKNSLRKLRTDSFTNITTGLRAAQRLLEDASPINTAQQPQDGMFSRLFDFVFQDPVTDQGKTETQTPSKISPRVILLTDGEHNKGPKPFRIAKSLKEQGTIIDCIGIGGSPSQVHEKTLKTIASIGENGKPRYCFIGDKTQLIRKFKQLANRIRPA